MKTKTFTEKFELLLRTQKTVLSLIPEQKEFNQEFVVKKPLKLKTGTKQSIIN